MGSLSVDCPDLSNLSDNPDSLFMWGAGDAARFDLSADELGSFETLDFLHADPQQAGENNVFRQRGQ